MLGQHMRTFAGLYDLCNRHQTLPRLLPRPAYIDTRVATLSTTTSSTSQTGPVPPNRIMFTSKKTSRLATNRLRLSLKPPPVAPLLETGLRLRPQRRRVPHHLRRPSLTALALHRSPPLYPHPNSKLSRNRRRATSGLSQKSLSLGRRRSSNSAQRHRR
jgi:hypothetical protein